MCGVVIGVVVYVWFVSCVWYEHPTLLFSPVVERRSVIKLVAL